MKLFRPLALVCLVGALLLASCEKKLKEPTRARVQGTVKYNNAEVKTGKITFDPQNGDQPTTLEIVDGKYEGKASLGKNRVMIRATEKVDMKKKMGHDGPGYDQPVEENYIPALYNTDSKLFREVEADDNKNTFNFDLKKG